jgi:hypothetical protein
MIRELRCSIVISKIRRPERGLTGSPPSFFRLERRTPFSDPHRPRLAQCQGSEPAQRKGWWRPGRAGGCVIHSAAPRPDPSPLAPWSGSTRPEWHLSADRIGVMRLERGWWKFTSVISITLRKLVESGECSEMLTGSGVVGVSCFEFGGKVA